MNEYELGLTQSAAENEQETFETLMTAAPGDRPVAGAGLSGTQGSSVVQESFKDTDLFQ